MTLAVDIPQVDRLGELVGALARWQRDDAPIQLHPGDLGWMWRFGAQAMAAALRTWSRDAEIVAIGLLDGPGTLRLTVAPETWRDDELARRIVADLADPGVGVLPPGAAVVESPDGTRLRDALASAGWTVGEGWTPLRRDVAEPVGTSDLRVEIVGPDQVCAFTEVHRSAWDHPGFTEEKWYTMAAGAPFRDARCLLGFADGVAVAGVTVWSAGPGRPGLIEPLGVHADHRRRGYGAAICVAAAAELVQMGASGTLVCTPGTLTSAIATYRAAGFRQLPERFDSVRPG